MKHLGQRKQDKAQVTAEDIISEVAVNKNLMAFPKAQVRAEKVGKCYWKLEERVYHSGKGKKIHQHYAITIFCSVKSEKFA